MTKDPHHWQLPGGSLLLDRPRVMGIVNLTPDSFSDGGELAGVDDALERARAMVEAGADLLDVGGESTRPGADAVPVDEEIARIVPFVRRAVRMFPNVPLSVDTRKAPVAEAALEAGARIVNDVSGLAFDPAMAPLVAARGAGVVVMHMRGTPADMARRAHYRDVVAEVRDELDQRLARARDAGVAPDAVVADPGLGFAKTAAQSLTLLRHLDALSDLGVPLLVGPSRKSFLGTVLGEPPHRRGAGTVAACVLAYLRGARIVRVHDVEPVVHALAVAHAVETADPHDVVAPPLLATDGRSPS